MYLHGAMPKTDSTAKVCTCPAKERRYVPHKRKLMVLVCANCGCRKRSTKSVADYNKKRRKLRLAEDLETISVPLIASSTTLIDCARASVSLESNTALAHVTLVEGLRAPLPDALVQALAATLACSPMLTVIDATTVPCKRDKNSTLVTLELGASAVVAERMQALAMHAGCALPQWPLHVILGISPKADAAMAARALLGAHRGTVLAVDASRIAALPPSDALFFSGGGKEDVQRSLPRG